MVIMYWYLLSFWTPEYVHLCLCCITMNIESIVFIYVCTYGHFKRWWILQTLHLLSFIAYRFTWIYHYHHFKVLNALSPFYDFYHVLLHEKCWMYYRNAFMYWILYMLCQKWRNKDVQSINMKVTSRWSGNSGSTADRNRRLQPG